MEMERFHRPSVRFVVSVFSSPMKERGGGGGGKEGEDTN